MFQWTNKLESGATSRFESWVNFKFSNKHLRRVIHLYVYFPIRH